MFGCREAVVLYPTNCIKKESNVSVKMDPNLDRIRQSYFEKVCLDAK